ncbi:hypothetical protein CAP31_11725 [Sulfuriferula sp. AH1]|uniref:ubiquinone biosynthesis accessory factor UbiJ n=1 Tax=Sulfuriferula sp. AH1 TaxID=1985873 RepID=UPI000B3B125E|nr:hypothetical protein [Sulfuriferula sp. AH1]ARU32283.1 hypothetical protein CAP31_11725 [Sulfuriferula sp. AH1]
MLSGYVIIATLNHLLNGAPWARQRLMGHAGKRIAIGLFPLQFAFAIDNEGRLQQADEDGADARMQLGGLLAARIALGDHAATHDIHISGDTQFAADFGNTLLTLDWDAEADLARFIGDSAAHQLVQIARNLIAWQRRTLADSAAMLTDYAHEEITLIAKRKHLDEFIAEVDRLRDASARLNKRIDFLTQRLKSDSAL